MRSKHPFFQLGADSRRLVHLSLCDDALLTWNGYVRGKPAALRYRDSVVGMWHHVDVELPADALRAARAGVDRADIGGRYLEPIVAMQDDDLAFPDSVELAYYAIYNCFRKYVRGDVVADWLIVSQALSVHPRSEVAQHLTRVVDDIIPRARGSDENVGPRE
ncbi:hypothetical protein [Nocardia sp. MW-W600-9]